MKLKIFIFILLSVKFASSVDVSWSEVDDIACTVSHFNGTDAEIDELIQSINKNKERYKITTTLQFVNSNFVGIPKRFCKNFPNVKKLYVSGVGLTIITRKELKLFKNLVELHANYNKLTKFRGDLFDFTPNIRKVYLMNNKINEINVDGLSNLKHLKVLDLRHNDCINEKFDFSCSKELSKFSKRNFENCKGIEVILNRKRRTLLPLLWLASYLDDKDERKKKKKNDNQVYNNRIIINGVEQGSQQEQQRQQQEQQRKQQEQQRKIEEQKRKKIEEEKRKKIEEEKKKKIRMEVEKVDKDNRFSELERIIKEQYKQFEIRLQELLIEYLKILQKNLEELQVNGILDQTTIKAKIRIITISIQKEVRVKYENVCKSVIEEALKASTSSSTTIQITEGSMIIYKGLKIPFESIHFPEIHFPTFKIIQSKGGKLVIHVTDGSQIGRIFNRENEMEIVFGGETKLTTEQPEIGQEQEIRIISVKIIEKLIQIYTEALFNYYKKLVASGLSLYEISIKITQIIEELELTMQNKLKIILQEKYPTVSIDLIQKIIITIKFPESVYNWVEKITEKANTETEGGVIESIDKEFNLEVMIHNIFVSIKIETVNKYLSQKDRERYEQQLKELEQKVEEQAFNFESIKSQLVEYCQKTLKAYLEQLMSQGNPNKAVIQKELNVQKIKIVHEMQIKLEQVIKVEIYKIIHKYTTTKTTSSGSEIEVIQVPNKPIEFPKIEIPVIQMPDIKIPQIQMPKIPEFKIPKIPEFKVPKIPEFEIPKIPEFEVPSMPEINIPKIPDIDIPKIPEYEIPEFKVPQIPAIEIPKIPEYEIPKIPDLNIPKIPKIKLPKIQQPKIPEVNIPDFEIPQIPDIQPPSIPEIPEISIPQPEIPDIPSVEMPNPAEIPQVTIPTPEFPDIEFPQPEFPSIPDIEYPQPEVQEIPDIEGPEFPEVEPSEPEVPDIPEEIESIDQEFNLQVIIHKIFMSIKIEHISSYENAKDRERYEQQLKELEQKVEQQAFNFESIKLQLIEHCKQILKSYLEKWTSQGNVDKVVIQKEFHVIKIKLVHEMKVKLEQIIKTEVIKIVEKYTTTSTSGGSYVKVIHVPKTQIEFPKMKMPKFPEMKFPDFKIGEMKVKEHKLPEFPSFNFPKPEFSSVNIPKLEFSSVNQPMPEFPSSNFPMPEFPSVNYPEPNFPSVNFPEQEIFKLPEIKITNGGEMKISADKFDTSSSQVMQQINMIIEKEIKVVQTEHTTGQMSQTERQIYEQKLRELEAKLKQQTVEFEKIRKDLVSHFIMILQEYSIKLQQQYKPSSTEYTVQLNIMKSKLEQVLMSQFEHAVKFSIEKNMNSSSSSSSHFESDVTVKHEGYNFQSPELLEEQNFNSFPPNSDESSTLVSDLMQIVEQEFDRVRNVIRHSGMREPTKKKSLNFLKEAEKLLMDKVPIIVEEHEAVWGEYIAKMKQQNKSLENEPKIDANYERKQRTVLKEQIKTFIDREIEKTMDKASSSKNWYTESIEHFKSMIKIKFGA